MANAKGKNILANINARAGLAPDLVRNNFAMLNELFNTKYQDWIGDTLTFDNLIIPDLTADTDKDDDCGEFEFECPESNQFTLTLDHTWHQGWKYSACRINKVYARIRMDYDNGTKPLFRFQKEIMLKKMKAEINEGIKKITANAGTVNKDITIDGTNIVNIIQAVNEAINNMQTKNEEIALEEYNLLISTSVAQKLGDLRTGCCDYINGLIPVNSTAPFSVRTYVMPDSMMNGNDYIIYIKNFAFYGHQCEWAEWEAGVNKLKGWLLFMISSKWGFNYVNARPELVTQLGQKGKFVKAATPPDGGGGEKLAKKAGRPKKVEVGVEEEQETIVE